MQKIQYKTVVRKVKVGNSGESASWIKENFKDLDDAFREFIYSDYSKNSILRNQYENKRGISGIGIQRMMKILEKNNYKIQIIVWNLQNK